MVNPDEISSGEGESISAPDILVVQVTNLYVLDNYILAGKGESLSLDNAFGSNAQDSLVGTNFDGSFRQSCQQSIQINPINQAVTICTASQANPAYRKIAVNQAQNC
jgi:hypothetical protein